MWEFRASSTHLHGVEIITSPVFELICNVFYTVKFENFPDLIMHAGSLMSWGQEFVHIRYFQDMDWEDKNWVKLVKEDEILDNEVFIIHDIFGERVYKNTEFDQFLFEYSSFLSQLHDNNEGLVQDWRSKMLQSLNSLEAKMRN